MFKEELASLEKDGLLRKLRWVEGEQAPRVVIDGREVINLCSNNYLGLANHPELKKAAKEAIERYGCSATASRLVVGSMEIHRQLEKKIAEFKKVESALIFSSGYMANLGIISTLVGRGDMIFSDKLNHTSIVDAILLSGAEFKRYPHKDVKALEGMLKRFYESRVTGHGSGKKLIITDTVFSMDGDIAPLPELVELVKEFDCMLMLDEAHATGVLGENGRGAVEYFGLEGRFNFIQMGTFGKALGSFGAYVAGTKSLTDYLINKSRPFIYTTGLPPSVAASSLAALEIVQAQPQLRQRLIEMSEFFRDTLLDMGFETLDSQSQIVPILIGDNHKAMEFSKRLFDRGIFIQGIRPPTVPKDMARLRVSVMATHTRRDLEQALEDIEAVGRGLGIIPKTSRGVKGNTPPGCTTRGEL